jgi:hypothetical protein
MAQTTTSQNKMNTDLKDYSAHHEEKTGPYADDLEVDALIVGAGFGESTRFSFPVSL